jgi:membrane associated rhomboid family serine protease
MMLIVPVSLSERPKCLPKGLIALTAAVWLAALAQFVLLSRNDFAPAAKEQWFELFGYDPTKPHWWKAFTALLIHADFWHSIVNLTGLWLFGWFVEAELGWQKFLAFGLIAHLIALKAQGAFGLWQGHPDPSRLVGSSAIVAFTMGTFCLRFRHIGLKWRAIYGWRWRSQEFSTPLWLLIALWLVAQIWSLVSQHPEKPVIAHLTSFAIGAIVAFGLGWHRLAIRDQLKRQAEAAEREGRWEEAASIWCQLALRSQNPSADWLAAAHNFLKAGNREKAEEAICKSLEHLFWGESALDRACQIVAEPKVQSLSPEVLFPLAEQLERHRRHSESLTLFQKVAEVAEFKWAPQALLKVAELNWRLGDEEKARQALHLFWLRYSQTPWRQKAAELAAQFRWRGEK